ncbi:hypothetical protein E1140_09490 [Fulvivirga lutimaris]|nr:hypothetical protein [Fulvivirga lutimaris]
MGYEDINQIMLGYIKNGEPSKAVLAYDIYVHQNPNVKSKTLYLHALSSCLDDNLDLGKRQFSRLVQGYREKLWLKAKKSVDLCEPNCRFLDFPSVEEDESQTRARILVTSNSNGRASIAHSHSGKYIQQFNYDDQPTKISKLLSYETSVERIFEPFNKFTISHRLKVEEGQLELYSVGWFDLVLYRMGSFNLEDIDNRLLSLNKSLDFYISQFDLDVPISNITTYVVEDTYGLIDLARTLHKYEPSPGTIGYNYHNDQSIIVATRNFYLGSINHEMVHILLKNSGLNYPSWYEEGLAATYETAYFSQDSLIPVNNWRNEWVKNFFNANSLSKINRRLRRLNDDDFFGAFISEDMVNFKEYTINASLARYLVMYILDTQSGFDPIDTHLEIWLEDNFHFFMRWYNSKFKNKADETYTTDFLIKKEDY